MHVNHMLCNYTPHSYRQMPGLLVLIWAKHSAPLLQGIARMRGSMPVAAPAVPQGAHGLEQPQACPTANSLQGRPLLTSIYHLHRFAVYIGPAVRR